MNNLTRYLIYGTIVSVYLLFIWIGGTKDSLWFGVILGVCILAAEIGTYYSTRNR